MLTDDLKTSLNLGLVHEYTLPQWQKRQFINSSYLGLSLSNSRISGYCSSVWKNLVKLVLMYYIFLFHSHQKSKIKQKQGRSEDKVSREITSMSCTCIFFSFYFSFSCGIVPPYINTKKSERGGLSCLVVVTVTGLFRSLYCVLPSKFIICLFSWHKISAILHFFKN